MLVDSFGRNLYYLRLSVTDRCQFSCSYCKAKEFQFLPKTELLTYEEIKRTLNIFKKLGTKKIRITGGEPLVRNRIDELMTKIHSMGLKTSLTTNGFLLKNFLPKIKDVVDSINVSLDSVHPETFEKISGMPSTVVKTVMNSISASKSSGIPTKINTVVMRENFEEIDDLIDFSKSLSVPIRFIEYMPHGESVIRSISFDEIREKIRKSRGLSKIDEIFGDGPAKYYKTEDGATVGFISYSQPHFCDTCNRLRITPDGKLRLCLVLGGELDLKTLLRNDLSDEKIEEKILNFIKLKPFSHGSYKTIGKKMNFIGG